MGLRLTPMLTVKPTACSCNVQFHGSLWATVGQVVSTGLEEEVTALVGVVTDEDSGMFSSQCTVIKVPTPKRGGGHYSTTLIP